ncbi:Uma2 family endonuclease [Cohnella silvisoli]|uniref:Uma2 family endonuclease n=1 Tax=Cohnella silvisoli TaxID=2873699 RepID=A0ABV1KNH0_9BACL|nr:Uma2 family endonuclease [Cohnella silvisoli]MCD9020667.1 Uma2 family endonuclease [Cohnella silvisoli]
MSEEEKDKRKEAMKEQQANYWIEERYEIIEGVRYDFLSSPRVSHQILVTELYASIRSTCHAGGIVLVAPMDVHFDENNIVQPDLIFIANDNLHIIKDGWVKGVPDLLVEILSPSTGSKDKVQKKIIYERFGVKEYWIVDPVYSTIDQLVFVDGKYRLEATYGEEDTLKSPNLTCISIDLHLLFQEAMRFNVQPTE